MVFIPNTDTTLASHERVPKTPQVEFPKRKNDRKVGFRVRFQSKVVVSLCEMEVLRRYQQIIIVSIPGI